MKPLRYSIYLIILGNLLLFTGCASVANQTRAMSNNSEESFKTLSTKDPASLSDREKWSIARKAFARAESERDRGNTESAARYYEIALDLLGGLDLASLDMDTQRVLTFNRKVLSSYDKFVDQIKSLPPNMGLTAVLEAGTLDDEEESEIEPINHESEIDTTPVFVLNHDPLPGVPTAMNSQVQGQISFFTKKGRGVMTRWMERSADIFPRLRPILREEGIPDEVMYLAMIESGLNLQAYSYASASGLWQFIPSTGRLYGLHIDRVYDERRHVELATRAACSYLRKLYEQFGDWYLAFAAYNCGEGRIEKEVQRNGTNNYWNLRRLPRQTKTYVPIYLAAREICENPERYGFPPLPPERPFEIHREFVHGPYKLADVASAAGVDAETVKELNPEFIKGVIPKAAEPFMVRMPAPVRDDFALRLQDMPETVIQPTSSHRVKRGETLAKIAEKYGTTVSSILSQPENKRINPRKMSIGTEIFIPVPSYTHTPSTETPQENTVASSSVEKNTAKETADQIVYTVHRGETLGKIGGQLGVSVDQICGENGISNPNSIRPGQKLRITVKGAPTYAAKKSSGAVYHTVERGDTVWSIAQAYQVDAGAIYKWNRLSRSAKIYPGQKLVVNR
jgi:membrane-bound lytic murein transglycosylase D